MKPVCCVDCASQYATDNQRRRIFITVGIVLGVVVLAFGIALVVIAGTRDTTPAVKRWNSTEVITVKPEPLFDTSFDINAQAYSLSLTLVDAINPERGMFGYPKY